MVAATVIIINSVFGGFGGVDLNVISCFNCPITGAQLQLIVRLHCPITTLQTN